MLIVGDISQKFQQQIQVELPVPKPGMGAQRVWNITPSQSICGPKRSGGKIYPRTFSILKILEYFLSNLDFEYFPAAGSSDP
jgi:hypothetical protein